MIAPLEWFDDRRPTNLAAWPDLPRDQERDDVDYDVMFDLYYLKRNNQGHQFFDDIQPDTYFVTPRGIVLKRCGPTGRISASKISKENRVPTDFWILAS